MTPKKSPPKDLREMRGSNHVGMRQFNERTVLRAIRHHGAMPKADLARLTQLTSQTVATIVNRLSDDGLLVKQARIRGKIGQPSVPLALNPEGAFSVGIQIGRRSLEVVVTDFLGHMRHQWQHLYPYPAPHDVLAKIQEGLQRMQHSMDKQWSRVVGIGLSAPLALHLWGDVMGEPAKQVLAQWEQVDLLTQVQQLTDLPIEFAKDTTAACVAELVQGHGRDIENFLYVFVGTFVGGGLVLDGHIINGRRGNAGAIGSMPMSTQSHHGLQLLELASGWQLEQALIQAGHDPLLVQQDAIVQDAYAQWVQPWLQQASHALAASMAAASALLDLDAVVVDGSLSPLLMQALMAHAEQALNAQRFDGLHQPLLLKGQVGGHARALGASLLPLHAQFFPDMDIFLKQSG